LENKFTSSFNTLLTKSYSRLIYNCKQFFKCSSLFKYISWTLNFRLCCQAQNNNLKNGFKLLFLAWNWLTCLIRNTTNMSMRRHKKNYFFRGRLASSVIVFLLWMKICLKNFVVKLLYILLILQTKASRKDVYISPCWRLCHRRYVRRVLQMQKLWKLTLARCSRLGQTVLERNSLGTALN
jgi:hypothetical protein